MAGHNSVDPRDRDLIREIYPALRRIAGVAGGAELEPDDLVQEALVRVLSRRNLADLDQPLAYMRRVISNLASNERRSHARRRKALQRLSTDEGWMPSYPADVEAILDLPPRQRAILYLVEVEGMPYAEVANELGISTAAARTTASRARKKARMALEVARG